MVIEETYLNIIKSTYDKPTANNILNNESLKSSLKRSGRRQGCPVSSPVFNIGLAVLATIVRQEKEKKDIQIEKEEVKLLLFADMIYISIHRKP